MNAPKLFSSPPSCLTLRKALALCGLALTALTLLLLSPTASRAQYGGYPGSGGWVPSDAAGTPLPQTAPALNWDGSVSLTGTAQTPLVGDNYPDPLSDWQIYPFWPTEAQPTTDLTVSSIAYNYYTDPRNMTRGIYNPGQYDRWESCWWPEGSDPPLIVGGVDTGLSNTLTAHFVWTGPDPVPNHANFLLNTTVNAAVSPDYGQFSDQPTALTGTATASLGADTVTASLPDTPSDFKNSKRLVLGQILDHVATVSLSGSVSAQANNHINAFPNWDPLLAHIWMGNMQTSVNATAGATATAKYDEREVAISNPTNMKILAYNADGSISVDVNGEQNYVAAPHAAIDGVMKGDTIYTYNSNYDGGVGGEIKNVQTFTARFSGNWHWKSRLDHDGNTIYDVPDVVEPDTWSWSTGRDSDDTWETTKADMPSAQNFHLFNGSPQGQDSPQEFQVSYSATDNTDGASATANYEMMVHDLYEKSYPDHVLLHQRENFKKYPGAKWVSNSDNKPADLDVHVDTAYSIDLTISAAGPLEEWIGEALGIKFDVSTSYEVSVGQGETVKDVEPGWGTYCMSYDVVNHHWGKADQWGAGGYVGTAPYNIRIHDDPPVGITAAPLVDMGGTPPIPPG